MDAQTAGKLLEINRRFYHEFGDAFAATRRRIQPGVSRILERIPIGERADWLDLGCGSGALGQIWAGQKRTGSYTGMDFSGPLLREAAKGAEGLSDESLQLNYVPGDLMDPEWTGRFDGKRFDGVLALASLHHIPGRENHLRIFRQVRGLLKPGGCFIFSVWQFQNSEKLMKRVQPWDLVQMEPDLLEPGDTLLDWRYALPGNSEKQGLRYVHLFSENELRGLMKEAGFCEQDLFYSDGAEGNLALYAELRTGG